MKRFVDQFGVLLGVTALLLACTGDRSAPPPLAGTEWSLVSIGDDRLIEDTFIKLAFEDGYYVGTMTCNGYGGTPDCGRYAGGKGGRFSIISPFCVTVQLCETPEGLMAQEDAYVETFQRAQTYRVEDGRLILLDVDDRAILEYVSADPVSVSLADILADPEAYEDRPVRVRGYGAMMMEIALCPGYTGLDQRTTFWARDDVHMAAVVKGDLDPYYTDNLRTFDGLVRVFRGEVGCPGETTVETIPYLEITGVVE